MDDGEWRRFIRAEYCNPARTELSGVLAVLCPLDGLIPNGPAAVDIMATGELALLALLLRLLTEVSPHISAAAVPPPPADLALDGQPMLTSSGAAIEITAPDDPTENSSACLRLSMDLHQPSGVRVLAKSTMSQPEARPQQA